MFIWKYNMKTTKRGLAASGLFCVAVLGLGLWFASTGHGAGEKSEIPAALKGKPFTIYYENNQSLQVTSILRVVAIGTEDWWQVQIPKNGEFQGGFRLVNPRQIQRIEVVL